MFNSEMNNVVYLSVVLYSDFCRSDFIAHERNEDTAYVERAKRVVMINWLRYVLYEFKNEGSYFVGRRKERGNKELVLPFHEVLTFSKESLAGKILFEYKELGVIF